MLIEVKLNKRNYNLVFEDLLNNLTKENEMQRYVGMCNTYLGIKVIVYQFK